MHICFSKLNIVGSDNGLLPGKRQAIIWTKAGILLIEPLGTKLQWNFNQNWNILNAIGNVICKMVQSCLGLNVIKKLLLKSKKLNEPWSWWPSKLKSYWLPSSWSLTKLIISVWEGWTKWVMHQQQLTKFLFTFFLRNSWALSSWPRQWCQVSKGCMMKA